MKPDQERLRVLLVDTIALLCKSGLGFKNELKIQGLLGITIDRDDVFIVHIDETFSESPMPSRMNVSAGRNAETKLVPEPVAELSESFTLSADNALSPQSGSRIGRKRLKMDVQPVKQERVEWEEDASGWRTTQQESSKIGMEDQNVISNVFGSETKSSEVVWIDSDVLDNSKDRISLESQPGQSFEAGNELVAFDRSKNDSCGSKLYDVPVSVNASGMIVKEEDEIEVKSDITRKHAYHHSRGRRNYSRTGVPLAVSTASVSPVYNTDDQWQTDEVVSYPIPTAVCWENEDEEETDQEDYQELSSWESNSQGPNKRSTQNGDREKRFVCQYDDCDKAFYRKDHLIRHQRTKHGKPFGVDSQTVYFCHFADCGRMFYKSTSLHRHMSDAHGYVQQQ